MRLMMLCIAVCWLLLDPGAGSAGASCTACHRPQAENCRDCHKKALKGLHADLPCLSCHESESRTLADPASAEHRGVGCSRCHWGYGALFDHAMGTRKGERLFAARTVGREDPDFFENRCGSCHLSGCADCHGGAGHALERANDRSCFACHKGYFVGTDYYGMAPREDSLRYQRGRVAYGETFLTMTPDLHAEAGLTCAACHSMASLAAGRKSSKGCLDCHRVSDKVVEHRIGAHLEKLECYACHSAWAAQEYGTFYLRLRSSPSQERYRVKENRDNWVKSAYLRRQDAPPLGLNQRGRVSPIRPEFIVYFSDIEWERPVGAENRLLAAEWRAFFPHTVRRGTVMCEGCHDSPRRFLLEREEQRIYRLQQDGMTLPSFWARSGQQVANGAFLPEERYRAMERKTPTYQRAYLEKWNHLIKNVDTSSSP